MISKGPYVIQTGVFTLLTGITEKRPHLKGIVSITFPISEKGPEEMIFLVRWIIHTDEEGPKKGQDAVITAQISKISIKRPEGKIALRLC